MTLYHFKINLASSDGRRIELHLGRDHLVVPVVMIVEGVLNDSLLLAEEFGKFPQSWDGRPVPVYHPVIDGVPVTANRPDVAERTTVGTVFNTRVDANRLVAELWIDLPKAGAIGYSSVAQTLIDGGIMEVSTGYYADDEVTSGEYNGVPYSTIHRNIRPDHLALLPGEIGACSIEDGCGTRINSKRSSVAMKVNEAWAALGQALGLNINGAGGCPCEETKVIDVMKEAEKLVKTNALDAKQLAAIQKMTPADREVMGAFIAALQMAGDPGGDVEEQEDEVLEEEEEMEDMRVQSQGRPAKGVQKPNTMTQADIDRLVTNKVDEHLRRRDVVTKLTANERNTLTEDQMKTMSVDQLETVEKMIRPADYSAAGGFATNGGRDGNVSPLPMRGVLATKKKEG